METENIYRLLLIEMLSKKEKSRINFLARKQKESDDGIDDFIDHLKDAHQYWIDIYIRANKDIIIGGGSRTIAMPNFKNTIYFGFIGELQLKLMRDEITNFINRFIKENPPKPQTFEEMFENIDIANKCFDVLKIVEPRIINEKNQFCIGERKKGAISAYIAGLKNGFISQLSDKTLATILNSKIDGLNLGADGRTLRKKNSTGYRLYYNKIQNILNDIKLSANGK